MTPPDQPDRDRHPTTAALADGITIIDTLLGHEREFNAVYLLEADEPTIVEAGPGADVRLVLEALASLGVNAEDLAHIVVTHVHVDHAGGSGALVGAFPSATVWVHERGAPHLADPTRLVASTARTYGEDRMHELYGQTLPVPADRLRAVADGDQIPLGGRKLSVFHTPGHASHHIALQDDRSGAIFTGEAVGSHLPWADAYRPALPPPEVDIEAALASIASIRARHPSTLLTSHFGPIEDPEEGCDRGAERIRTWAETVRRRLEANPEIGIDELTDSLRMQAAQEYLADSGSRIGLDRYDAIGSIRMNAQGLQRYWRKRWEREAAPTTGGPAE
jgi:glyoxylase-like metal-dependent hydrolase (beta-lactamase superfamily II)